MRPSLNFVIQKMILILIFQRRLLQRQLQILSKSTIFIVTKKLNVRELSIFFSLFQMNIHYYCEIETSRPNLRLYLFATLQLKAQELPRQTVSVIKYVSRRFIIDGQRVSQP